MKFNASRLSISSVALIAAAFALAGAVRPPTPVKTAAAQTILGVACQAQQKSFPTGFGYPQAARTLETWVASRDIKQTREHGWGLWAGLNAVVGGTPVWKSWCTETQAFGPPVVFHSLTGALATANGSRPMRQFKFDNVLYAEALGGVGLHVSVRQHGCRCGSPQYIQAASAV